MVKLEYIDTVKYEAGCPKAVFLLADKENMTGRRAVIFGTGLEAFFAAGYLEKQGVGIDCFINNDPKMAGKYFCNKPIRLPDSIWGRQFFIVAAMGNVKYLNEVLWQCRVHKETEYAIVFMENYHVFADNSASITGLQDIAIEVTNRILCDGRRMDEVIHPVMNVGPAGNLMFDFVELCWTTTWSHHLLQWFYEKYFQKDFGQKLDMLEIGPGRGFFSVAANCINSRIDIEWLMFELEESSEEAVAGRYKWWPANQYRTYYGVIESPGYRISKKFDIIVMTEVMEHFSANPRTAVRKIADMLKEDGEIYLSTPVWGHLPIYDTYYDIPDFTSMEEYKASYIGHSYQYTRQELERILDECGLRMDKYALTDGNNHNMIVRHKCSLARDWGTYEN